MRQSIGVIVFACTILSLAVFAQPTEPEKPSKWEGYNIIASGSFFPAQDYPWFIMDEFQLTYWKSDTWGFGIENQIFPLIQLSRYPAIHHSNAIT